MLLRFAEMLEELFPRAVPESVFVQHMFEVLNNLGYNKNTSINLVSTCRDELCRPFTELLDGRFTNHFDIGSLAGFVFCGRTGFKVRDLPGFPLAAKMHYSTGAMHACAFPPCSR